MDEVRRQALLDELTDARAERDRLTAYIEALSVRLGVGSTPEPPVNEVAADGVAPTTNDPSTLVYPGEFVGMSLPKASEEVLRRFSPKPHRRPLRTAVLAAALRKGGLDVESPRVLYRSLFGHSRFHKLAEGRGMWGLTEWYPASVRNKAKTQGDDATGAELPLSGAPRLVETDAGDSVGVAADDSQEVAAS
jgi:hypothetical protein